MSYDRDKSTVRSSSTLIAPLIILILVFLSAAGVNAEYKKDENNNAGLPYSQLRSGFALFKLGRFKLAANKWQEDAAQLIKHSLSENAISLEKNQRLVGIAYLLSAIAYERAGSTNSYDSWANASRYFLHSGTRWELERVKLSQRVERDAAQLDLLAEHPELLGKLAKDSPIGEDRLLLLEIERFMKVSEYQGPALGLREIAHENEGIGVQQTNPEQHFSLTTPVNSRGDNTANLQEPSNFNDSADGDKTLVDLHWNQRQVARTIRNSAFADRSAISDDRVQGSAVRTPSSRPQRAKLNSNRPSGVNPPTAPRPLAARSVTGYGNSVSVPDRQLKYLQAKSSHSNSRLRKDAQEARRNLPSPTISVSDDSRASIDTRERHSSNATAIDSKKLSDEENDTVGGVSNAYTSNKAHQGIKGEQLYRMWFEQLEEGRGHQQNDVNSRVLASEVGSQIDASTRLGRIKLDKLEEHLSESDRQDVRGIDKSPVASTPREVNSPQNSSKLIALKHKMATNKQQTTAQAMVKAGETASIPSASSATVGTKEDSTIRVFALEDDDEVYETTFYE